MTDTTTTGEILVQDTLGRVRTPREKREQILDEYERSGMSGAAFAALVGVKYSTLSSWIQHRCQKWRGGEFGYGGDGALGRSGAGA